MIYEGVDGFTVFDIYSMNINGVWAFEHVRNLLRDIRMKRSFYKTYNSNRDTGFIISQQGKAWETIFPQHQEENQVSRARVVPVKQAGLY